MSHDQDQHDTLPDAIAERLRARDRAVSLLTPKTDRAVAEAARAQFASRPARRERVSRWRYPAAVAAAVALVTLLVMRPLDEPAVDSARLADDVDGSGRVDILDAFALARLRAADPEAVSESRIDELTDRIVSVGETEAAL